MRGIEPPLASRDHSSDVDRAWMTIPASAPTTVPLIRMNCRSRPTCRSTLRAVSGASHRLTVSLLTVASSSRYVVTTCAATAAGQWPPRRLEPPLEHSLLQHVLHVVVGEHGEHSMHECTQLHGDPFGVRR